MPVLFQELQGLLEKLNLKLLQNKNCRFIGAFYIILEFLLINKQKMKFSDLIYL